MKPKQSNIKQKLLIQRFSEFTTADFLNCQQIFINFQ